MFVVGGGASGGSGGSDGDRDKDRDRNRFPSRYPDDDRMYGPNRYPGDRYPTNGYRPGNGYGSNLNFVFSLSCA